MAQVQLVEKDAPSWLDWALNFDATLKAFLATYAKLKAQRVWIAANQPSLLKTHDAVMQKFRDQIPTIDNLGQLRVDVGNWLNATGRFIAGAANALAAIPGYFGTGGQVIAQATGLTDLFRTVGGWFGLGGDTRLGLAPVIWVGLSIAGAATALAVVIQVMQGGAVYAKTMDAYIASIKAGASPEQAANAVRDAAGSAAAAQNATTQEFLGIPITTIVWGVAAIVLVPPILKHFEGRR